MPRQCWAARWRSNRTDLRAAGDEDHPRPRPREQVERRLQGRFRRKEVGALFEDVARPHGPRQPLGERPLPGDAAAPELLGVDRIGVQPPGDDGREHGGDEQGQDDGVVAGELEPQHGGHDRRVRRGGDRSRHPDQDVAAEKALRRQEEVYQRADEAARRGAEEKRRGEDTPGAPRRDGSGGRGGLRAEQQSERRGTVPGVEHELDDLVPVARHLGEVESEQTHHQASERAPSRRRQRQAPERAAARGEQGHEGGPHQPGHDAEHRVGPELAPGQQGETTQAVKRPAAQRQPRERGGDYGRDDHGEDHVERDEPGDDLEHEQHRGDGRVVRGGEPRGRSRRDEGPGALGADAEAVARHRAGRGAELQERPLAADRSSGDERGERAQRLPQRGPGRDASPPEHDGLEDLGDAVASRPSGGDHAQRRRDRPAGGGQGEAQPGRKRSERPEDVGLAVEAGEHQVHGAAE